MAIIIHAAAPSAAPSAALAPAPVTRTIGTTPRTMASTGHHVAQDTMTRPPPDGSAVAATSSEGGTRPPRRADLAAQPVRIGVPAIAASAAAAPCDGRAPARAQPAAATA